MPAGSEEQDLIAEESETLTKKSKQKSGFSNTYGLESFPGFTTWLKITMAPPLELCWRPNNYIDHEIVVDKYSMSPVSL